MANARKLIPRILESEGGFVNDPDDAGGATMKGVTLKTYKAYCEGKRWKEPTVDDLKKITQKEWDEIFMSMYWNKCGGDKIKNQSVADIFVDFYYNAGTRAIKEMQALVGAEQDGIVGKKTIEAINAQDPETLFEAYKKRRIAYYGELVAKKPSQQKFLKGWLNRVNSFKFEK